MCSGRRRSNGRRIEMEKSPAALRRCRIILCPEFARAFLLSDRVLARLHPKGTSSRFARRAPRRLAPRNDKSGAITVLTGACTSRQRCAGSGMPLPYNSGCGRRNCFKICNCQWHSGSAAAGAVESHHPFNGAIISHTRRGTAACGRFLGGGTARPACRILPRRRAPEK